MILELELLSVLDHEAACLRNLLAVLGRENQALLNADVEALEKATEEKNHALTKQASATQARQNITLASPYTDDESGLLELIDTCENREQLIEDFSQLTRLARECHNLNRNNGQLIVQKQKQANGALGILRQGDGLAPIYSVQGKTSSTLATRSLGKA